MLVIVRLHMHFKMKSHKCHRPHPHTCGDGVGFYAYEHVNSRVKP